MISCKRNAASRWGGGQTFEFRCDGVGLILELACDDLQAEAISRALQRAVEAGKKERSAELLRLLGGK